MIELSQQVRALRQLAHRRAQQPRVHPQRQEAIAAVQQLRQVHALVHRAAQGLAGAAHRRLDGGDGVADARVSGESGGYLILTWVKAEIHGLLVPLRAG